jgi:hypothetical protein
VAWNYLIILSAKNAKGEGDNVQATLCWQDKGLPVTMQIEIPQALVRRDRITLNTSFGVLGMTVRHVEWKYFAPGVAREHPSGYVTCDIFLE